MLSTGALRRHSRPARSANRGHIRRLYDRQIGIARAQPRFRLHVTRFGLRQRDVRCEMRATGRRLLRGSMDRVFLQWLGP